jgi:hypothetical protein
VPVVGREGGREVEEEEEDQEAKGRRHC